MTDVKRSGILKMGRRKWEEDGSEKNANNEDGNVSEKSRGGGKNGCCGRISVGWPQRKMMVRRKMMMSEWRNMNMAMAKKRRKEG